jgi:hypothetical protein
VEYKYSTGGVPPKPYPELTTKNMIDDSTGFIITTLANGHFTIQPEGFPGWYLNAEHDYQPGSPTEFIEGQPQEFWFEPWE